MPFQSACFMKGHAPSLPLLLTMTMKAMVSPRSASKRSLRVGLAAGAVTVLAGVEKLETERLWSWMWFLRYGQPICGACGFGGPNCRSRRCAIKLTRSAASGCKCGVSLRVVLGPVTEAASSSINTVHFGLGGIRLARSPIFVLHAPQGLPAGVTVHCPGGGSGGECWRAGSGGSAGATAAGATARHKLRNEFWQLDRRRGQGDL